MQVLAQDAAFARAAADLTTLTQEHVRAVLSVVDVKALIEFEIVAGVQRYRASKGSCGEARLSKYSLGP